MDDFIRRGALADRFSAGRIWRTAVILDYDFAACEKITPFLISCLMFFYAKINRLSFDETRKRYRKMQKTAKKEDNKFAPHLVLINRRLIEFLFLYKEIYSILM